MPGDLDALKGKGLDTRIPLNSKIYIATFKSEDATKPVEGFETYMAAAMRKKGVPVIMSQAFRRPTLK